jgi:hypothetical protein
LLNRDWTFSFVVVIASFLGYLYEVIFKGEQKAHPYVYILLKVVIVSNSLFHLVQNFRYRHSS